MAFAIGEKVQWNWGAGTGTGEVAEIFTARVSHTIKGKAITRNASPEDPAYLVTQADGDSVLKSASELTKG